MVIEKNKRNELPIVVVGSGPVGMRVIEELHKRNPNTRVVLYGDEAWDPYNRVKLSSYLAGEAGLDDLKIASTSDEVIKRFNCRVTAIDRNAHCIVDAERRHQFYSKLILATGSKPHVPDIPGNKLKGVYTFRDMIDANRLLELGPQLSRVVVIGGGLLGLETAKAMLRFDTKITIIEHNSHLMFKQLDSAAAAQLLKHVEVMGVDVLLNRRAIKVQGVSVAKSVLLDGGDTLDCDAVIFAAGIRPNVELALNCGIVINRGIRVNDQMQTSDPDIYAVGECAEHREIVYGLVSPGYEQAAVAAHVLSGFKANYLGSTSATNLKVVGLPVFSMGRVGEQELPSVDKEIVYTDAKKDIYRRVLIHRDRMVGVNAVGAWDQLGRIQDAVTKRRRFWPWQVKRFTQTGSFWVEPKTDSVSAWPANATICNCTGVTRGKLSKCIERGCGSVESLAKETGASTVCGTCKPLLQQLVGSISPAQPISGFRILAGSGLAAVLLVLMTMMSPVLGYAETVQVNWHWDNWWRESVLKQITGYSLLTLTVIVLLLSLRKRITFMRKWGEFSIWRMIHTLVGVLSVIVLVAHTGLRFGNNLNFLLMAAFTSLILVGGLLGGVQAFEHKLSVSLSQTLRKQSLWIHILIFWPLPALLLFHVLKTYYY